MRSSKYNYHDNFIAYLQQVQAHFELPKQAKNRTDQLVKEIQQDAAKALMEKKKSGC